MNCQRSTSVSSVPHPRFTFIPSLTFCGINSVQSVDRLHSPTSAAMSVSPSGYQPRARDFILISNGFALTLFPTTKHMFPTLFAWTDSNCVPISSATLKTRTLHGGVTTTPCLTSLVSTSSVSSVTNQIDIVTSVASVAFS